MSANATRGEIPFTLEGQQYVLRPSWEAIDQFETETGKGVLQLAVEAREGTMKSREVAAVATACIRAWGRSTETELAKVARDVDKSRVGELIMDSESGLSGAMSKIAVLLVLAATGEYTASGELKPATEKKKRETAAG